jgi:hypothetical protein
MRKAILTLGAALVCIAAAGASPGARADDTVVYLDGPAALARLRAGNPVHYQRAVKIIDAANELCRPNIGAIEYAKFAAQNVACVQASFRTSNPPKRNLSFRLDNTQYLALVTVTDDPPRLVAAFSR